MRRCEELMQQQNVTWDDLASLLDYPELKTHCDSGNPMKNVVTKIADLLECNVGYLMGVECLPYAPEAEKKERKEKELKNRVSPEIDLGIYKKRLSKLGWGAWSIAAFCRLNNSSKIYTGKSMDKIHFNNLLHCLECSEEYLSGQSKETGSYPAYIPEIGYKRYAIKNSEIKHITGIPKWFLYEIKNGLAIPERAARLLDDKLKKVREAEMKQKKNKAPAEKIEKTTIKYKHPDKMGMRKLNSSHNSTKQQEQQKQVQKQEYKQQQVVVKEYNIPELLEQLGKAYESMKVCDETCVSIANPRLKAVVEKLSKLHDAELENILNVVDVMISNVK